MHQCAWGLHKKIITLQWNKYTTFSVVMTSHSIFMIYGILVIEYFHITGIRFTSCSITYPFKPENSTALQLSFTADVFNVK